jgi:hypothetical protein
MEEKVLSQIKKEEVDLSSISIIIGKSGLKNEGMKLLCSQKLSHATVLLLSKTIDIKFGTK